MSIDLARQEIQKQKELPTLSPDIQRILTACQDPELAQHALAKTLGESPTISARLLGLANSAFFGQQGRVHSLPYAISVLGLVTVRSIAVGLALSGVFRTERCPHFQSDRYWASAVMTALMSNELNPYVEEGLRPNGDSVYMAGLLHNIGLPVLVHIYPEQMDKAFAAYEADPARRLGEHIRDKLNVDHYQAGMWLG
ncbi:MAG: HDOD domain-containing protein, partial [Sulfuricellaceae bacterium]|nr:HDOD domain-containing protein [Sulfuricellaceae bacterium]